ncbi:hypothetical protein N5V81_13585 [Escherichia coli]|nr:hypothetical protein [Escherichia coli]
MRFKHQTVVLAKKAFLVRLSYIITRVTAKRRYAERHCVISRLLTVTISAIKNEREKAVTIETLMRVADTLRLNYEIVYRSSTVNVVIALN